MTHLMACSGNTGATETLQAPAAADSASFAEKRFGDWTLMVRFDNSESESRGCTRAITPDTVYEMIDDNDILTDLALYDSRNIESVKTKVRESAKTYPSSRYIYLQLLDSQCRYAEAAGYADSFNDLYRLGLIAATLRALDEAVTTPDDIEAIATRLEKDLDTARPRSRKYAMEMERQVALIVEAVTQYAYSNNTNAKSNARRLITAISNGAATHDGPLRPWLSKKFANITSQ